MKRFIVAAVLVMAAAVGVFAGGKAEKPTEIRALILPKFEVGGWDDAPGEAQFYYNEYVAGGNVYAIKGGFKGNKLYVKNGVALYVTGMAKVNTSTSLTAILSDPRFDFSKAWIFSTGCAGGATELTVMGDVVIVSAVADFDLGHHINPLDLPDYKGPYFIHDTSYDSAGYFQVNPKYVQRMYELTKDVELAATEKAQSAMAKFGGDWSTRPAKVVVGAAVSGDNYWKGYADQATANVILQSYGSPDPFYAAEMEDVALGVVAARFGLGDRYFIIRDVVNMAVPPVGLTPLDIWGDLLRAGEDQEQLSSDDSIEAADIFPTAMENNFKVGKIILDAILEGKF
jgi:purine nucleoside permease